MRIARVVPALFIGLALTGCTTVLLPNARTGRCYSAQHAYVSAWGHVLALADAVDGWRCKGMQPGDLALIGDKPGVKPAEPPPTTR